MADTLTPRSPLQHYASRFSQLPESANLAEEPFVALVALWVDPLSDVGRAAARALGLDTLPTAPSTVVAASESTVIWLGPDDFLVRSTRLAAEELELRLREVVSGNGGAAVDVSAQRTTLRLRGAHARDVLAKGCAIDLHPKVFGPGAAVQTMLARANVILIPLADNGTDYRILVRSSFAGYLAEWLLDAAGEFMR